MSTKKEREYYNLNRAKVCKALGITINDCNWFRREGEKLRALYCEVCNGTLPENNGSIYLIENKIRDKAEKLSLNLYMQTDPRGATVYLSMCPLNPSNYNSGYCMY